MIKSKPARIEMEFDDGRIVQFTNDAAVELQEIVTNAVLWKQCNDGVKCAWPTFQIQDPSSGIRFVQRDPGGARSDRIPCTACNGRGWIEEEKKERAAKTKAEEESVEQPAEEPAMAVVLPATDVPAAASPLMSPEEAAPSAPETVVDGVAQRSLFDP